PICDILSIPVKICSTVSTKWQAGKWRSAMARLADASGKAQCLRIALGFFESLCFPKRDAMGLKKPHFVAWLLGCVLAAPVFAQQPTRSEEHTSELQSQDHTVCRT